MSKELAVVITAIAGGLVAAQAPVNNMVSQRLGSLGAVTVNFVVGTTAVLLITFAFAAGSKRTRPRTLPPGTTGSSAASPASRSF